MWPFKFKVPVHAATGESKQRVRRRVLSLHALHLTLVSLHALHLTLVSLHALHLTLVSASIWGRLLNMHLTLVQHVYVCVCL